MEIVYWFGMIGSAVGRGAMIGASFLGLGGELLLVAIGVMILIAVLLIGFPIWAFRHGFWFGIVATVMEVVAIKTMYELADGDIAVMIGWTCVALLAVGYAMPRGSSDSTNRTS